MAEELILIPKRKYDHLLKQVESEKNQIGGKKDTVTHNASDQQRVEHHEDSEDSRQDEPVKIPKLQQKTETAKIHELQQKTDSEEGSKKNTESKPTLYVERPVARILETAGRPKRKWINYIVW